MKKIYAFIAVCAMTISASAQIVSSRSRSIVVESEEKVEKIENYANYKRLFVSYSPMSFSGDVGKHMDTATGFALGWQKGWSVSKTMPVYIESGFNFKYNRFNDSATNYYGDKEEETDNYLSLNIPLNLAYKYSIPGVEGLSLVPYIGFHLTSNIIGTATYEAYGQKYDINFFEEEDMGDGNAANRFQFGWQIGVGLNYKALYVGIGYSAEFTEYIEDVNTGGITLTLGLNL